MDMVLAMHSMVLFDEVVTEGEGKMMRFDAITPMLRVDQRGSPTSAIEVTHHFAPELVDVLSMSR